MKQRITLFISILLLLIAFISLLPSAIIGFIYTVIKALVKRKLSEANKRIKDYFFAIALSVDQLANVFNGDLFNSILITKDSKNKFGDPDETISSVLGKNKKSKTLKLLGIKLADLLDKIEPNHTIRSIE